MIRRWMDWLNAQPFVYLAVLALLMGAGSGVLDLIFRGTVEPAPGMCVSRCSCSVPAR